MARMIKGRKLPIHTRRTSPPQPALYHSTGQDYQGWFNDHVDRGTEMTKFSSSSKWEPSRVEGQQFAIIPYPRRSQSSVTTCQPPASSQENDVLSMAHLLSTLSIAEQALAQESSTPFPADQSPILPPASSTPFNPSQPLITPPPSAGSQCPSTQSIPESTTDLPAKVSEPPSPASLTAVEQARKRDEAAKAWEQIYREVNAHFGVEFEPSANESWEEICPEVHDDYGVEYEPPVRTSFEHKEERNVQLPSRKRVREPTLSMKEEGRPAKRACLHVIVSNPWIWRFRGFEWPVQPKGLAYQIQTALWDSRVFDSEDES